MRRWQRWCLGLALIGATLAMAAAPPDPPVDLDIQQIPIRTLLLNLARFSQKNLLISPQIEGEMSLHIDQMPWSDVLQFIVRSQNLSIQQMGAITYIGTLSEANQQRERWLNEQAQGPLKRVFMPLVYAKASEVLALIKAPDSHILSVRGSIQADPRTNSLWLEDIPERLQAVQTFIHHLDTATPEIAIEARIVTIDVLHERDLGIQFGVNSLHHLNGTLAGADQSQRSNSGQVPVSHRLNVNLPAQPTDGQAASVGLAMFKIADGYALDVALSALEAQGYSKLIASPKLLTLNQHTASIETGEEIPYQEKTSSGATNVAFKKAVLSLAVTPQIIRQRVLLTLKISQDKASSREVNGVPAIDTREITTQVLVDNGQILVLGGIYETDKQRLVKRVPLLGDIPWLGSLFSYHHDSDQKRELLIFIKPTLVKVH